ncbi:MAG: DNA polymerase domain-containing protein, partial [Anaerolineae bacterium]|nr:DNA polymerase domain-containing protein [Anaerolineae bacterium]
MTAVAPVREAEIAVEGETVRLHNLHKVFWPDLGLTKADLINYYLRVAPNLLPHLKGRPFIMKPYPNGAAGRSYYRWEIPAYAPDWVHRWRYHPKTEERVIDMVVVEGLADLIWVANQGCIEMHPWLSRCDDALHPDLALFDLDPGPGAGFARTLRVAARLHGLLQEMGTRSYPKTSGGKGVHVLVPVERRYTFREVREWVKAVARLLAEAHPAEVTATKAAEAR